MVHRRYYNETKRDFIVSVKGINAFTIARIISENVMHETIVITEKWHAYNVAIEF